jgi:hypothetical protein
VGVQHERPTQNPHHDKPSGQRRHSRDPKVPGAEVPRRSACDVPLTQPFQAPSNIFRSTTEELCNVTA